MIVPAVDLVVGAAQMIGDPQRRRVQDDYWLSSLQSVVRTVAKHLPLLEQRFTFDVTLDDRYPYPDNMVSVREIRYTATPSDPDSYYTLDEKDLEWLTGITQSQYQTGDPLVYVPRPTWFHLHPKSPIAISDGGRMDAYVVPDLPTSISSGTVELPIAAIDHIIDGMAIEGYKALRMYDVANSMNQAWEEEERIVMSDLLLRSKDRRKIFIEPITLGRQV